MPARSAKDARAVRGAQFAAAPPGSRSPQPPFQTRAGRRESQQANLDALRLVLDDDDRAAIARLPKDGRVVNVDFAPAWDPPDVR